jgi:hypothetical protein
VLAVKIKIRYVDRVHRERRKERERGDNKIIASRGGRETKRQGDRETERRRERENRVFSACNRALFG